jgi:hypothetical protein
MELRDIIHKFIKEEANITDFLNDEIVIILIQIDYIFSLDKRLHLEFIK